MSTTYISNIVAVLAFGLPFLGIEVVDQGTLMNTLTQFLGFVALLYNFYGRFRAGGIDAFGLRSTR